MKRRKFVFMPTDNPNALLFASVKGRMESQLGQLLAASITDAWSSPQEALHELLQLLYSIDLATAVAGREFPDSEAVQTMMRQWALAAPRALNYLTGLSSTPNKINLTEIAHWFAFFTVRRQTLELNDIPVPLIEESPVK